MRVVFSNVDGDAFLARGAAGRLGFAFFPHEGQPFPKVVSEV
jgi:hypothetical protein